MSADLPVVLAFYRRELAAQNWKEETGGAVVTDNDVTLNFSSAGSERARSGSATNTT